MAHPSISLHPVSSSNIHAIGYDAPSQTLAVEFTPKIPGGLGARWHYEKVPTEIYEQLRAAPSIGSYFARQIRSRFAGTAVAPPSSVDGA